MGRHHFRKPERRYSVVLRRPVLAPAAVDYLVLLGGAVGAPVIALPLLVLAWSGLPNLAGPLLALTWSAAP